MLSRKPLRSNRRSLLGNRRALTTASKTSSSVATTRTTAIGKRQPTPTRVESFSMIGSTMKDAQLAGERRRANYIRQETIDDMQAEIDTKRAQESQDDDGGFISAAIGAVAEMALESLLGSSSSGGDSDTIFAGLGGESAGGGADGSW